MMELRTDNHDEFQHSNHEGRIFPVLSIVVGQERLSHTDDTNVQLKRKIKDFLNVYFKKSLTGCEPLLTSNTGGSTASIYTRTTITTENSGLAIHTWTQIYY